MIFICKYLTNITLPNIKAEAAEKRTKTFKGGAGGEKLKAKQKKLEEYEKRNRDLGGDYALKWQA